MSQASYRYEHSMLGEKGRELADDLARLAFGQIDITDLGEGYSFAEGALVINLDEESANALDAALAVTSEASEDTSL